MGWHLGKFALGVLNVSLLMSPCNDGDGDVIMMMAVMMVMMYM